MQSGTHRAGSALGGTAVIPPPHCSPLQPCCPPAKCPVLLSRLGSACLLQGVLGGRWKGPEAGSWSQGGGQSSCCLEEQAPWRGSNSQATDGFLVWAAMCAVANSLICCQRYQSPGVVLTSSRAEEPAGPGLAALVPCPETRKLCVPVLGSGQQACLLHPRVASGEGGTRGALAAGGRGVLCRRRSRPLLVWLHMGGLVCWPRSECVCGSSGFCLYGDCCLLIFVPK